MFSLSSWQKTHKTNCSMTLFLYWWHYHKHQNTSSSGMPSRTREDKHTHTHTQTHQKQIGSSNTYLTRHHVKRSEVRHSVLWHCGRCIFFEDFLLFFGEHLFDGPPMRHLKWLPILMQNSIRICYSTHQRPLKSRALRILRKSLLQTRRRIHYRSPKIIKNPLAPQPSGREETDICVKYP
jgi:hypothetical protein